jgi:chromate transporter
MQSPPAPPAPPTPDNTPSQNNHHPDVRELFVGFLGLGMTAFGGALPLAHRMVVEQRRWASDAEFTELLGLCQFLPGGNIINLSVALGMRFRGIKGALAALCGLIAVPTAVVVLLSILYQHYQSDPHIKHLFAGLSAAAAGLLIRMTIKLALPISRTPVKLALAVACFVTIALLRVPLLWAMLIMTPVSIAVCAKWGGSPSDTKRSKKT